MSPESIAAQRRHKEVIGLTAKRADIQRTIDQGVHDMNGAIDPYKSSRIPVLHAEIERIDAEIAELEALEGEALGRKYCPEGYPGYYDNFVPLTETLARPRDAFTICARG